MQGDGGAGGDAPVAPKCRSNAGGFRDFGRVVATLPELPRGAITTLFLRHIHAENTAKSRAQHPAGRGGTRCGSPSDAGAVPSLAQFEEPGLDLRKQAWRDKAVAE